MTKKQAREIRREFNLAIKEGRVVRYGVDSCWDFRSFSSAKAAREFLRDLDPEICGNIVDPILADPYYLD